MPVGYTYNNEQNRWEAYQAIGGIWQNLLDGRITLSATCRKVECESNGGPATVDLGPSDLGSIEAHYDPDEEFLDANGYTIHTASEVYALLRDYIQHLMKKKLDG